jgi:BirA family transcriptional regulator, biotin operon repressor / biotin---[acetyl-CoA-carboxylase] ligase
VGADEGAAGGWRLKIFETLGSTSDLCRNFADNGEPAGLAVLARRQQRGRGREGRTWISTPGNLFLSVLLRPPGAMREAGSWSLVAAVALADALAPLLPDGAALTLKWPNDVLLNGGKVAGILLDSTANAAGDIGWLVIGFGVNLTVAPVVPGRAVASIADVVTAPEPERVAQSLLFRLDHWRGMREREGLAPIREAWLARAHPAGTPLSLKLGEQEIEGEFAGLAEDGSLLLQTAGRVRAFAAGETAAGQAVPRERG